MNSRRLGGLYNQLSIWERIPLLIAADHRSDDVEYRRLFESAPQKTHEFPNHLLAEQAIHLCALIYITEQLDAAANYFFAAFQMQHDESDDWVFATSAASYFFTANAAAWRTFCERLTISPQALVAGNYRGMLLQMCEERMPERAPTAETLQALRQALGRNDGPLVTVDGLVADWEETLRGMTLSTRKP